MALNFKINTSAEAIKESSGGSFISKSGIYGATIKFASLDVSKNGAESVNFNLDYNGSDQTIYGPYVTSKAGDPLEIGLKLVNKLGIIAGMQAGQELAIEEEEHPVGKDKKLTKFNVITNFSDLPIKIRIQMEYSINPNTNEIQERRVIKNFFAENGASAEELLAGKEPGGDLAINEKYADNITYRDDLTPEDVEAWKEAKKSGSKASTPKPAAAKKPATGGLFK